MSAPVSDELDPLPPPGREPDRPSPRPPATLRRRLLVSLVGVSLGSVLVAGLLTVVFARRADRATAVAEMRRSLAGVAEAEQAGEQLLPLARLERILAFQGIGLVVITDQRRVTTAQTGPLGRRFPGLPFDRRNTDLDAAREAAELGSRGRLPVGIDSGDLDVEALVAGRVDTGQAGSLLFVAQPLARKNAGVPVLVATRRAPSFGRLGGVLSGAGLVAGLAAAGLSLWLVRRLTRPLQAMEQATRAIAGGDLGARVGGLAEADDELARLGAAIDAMAAELERSAGLERAFLMSVSHDLRTPLTSIRGYAEAVADGATDDDESRRRAATIIGSEARRLERLVADLLDLARLDAREFSLHPRPVDAAQVVAGAVEALQPAAAEAGLHLAAIAAPAPLPATLDPERLAQMVANLVENALKYAAGSVEVRVEPTPGGLEIAVTDDGPGVDPADLPHVFERLYTSRRRTAEGTSHPGPGRKVGTGLGLAIVAQLAEAMGGTVQAGRTPEGLTRFAVSVAARPDGSSSKSGGGWSSSSPSPSASSSSSRAPSS